MMEEKYVKDMLEDIKNLALNGNINGIIAMCENEIEVIEKRTLKQEVVDTVKLIEDAKYEITRLRHDDTDDLYNLLNSASKFLRNLAIKIELSSSDQTER